MAKAIEWSEMLIHCDTCHHEFEGVPKEWHNKNCPACSAPNIVCNDDMDIFNRACGRIDVINKLYGEVEETEKREERLFDTAKIRGLK